MITTIERPLALAFEIDAALVEWALNFSTSILATAIILNSQSEIVHVSTVLCGLVIANNSLWNAVEHLHSCVLTI